MPARRKAAPAWNDDDLADDVATLSYERALRTHARYHASSAPTEQLPAGQPLTDQLLTGQSRTQTADPEPIGLEKPFSLEEFLSEAGVAAPQAELRPAVKLKSGKNQDLAAKSFPASDRPQTTDCERNLKEASVTIRMSKAECAQLHQRAAEAGLTVSAYLRSCTFEAESLREMVKETLAQLRSATTEAKPANSKPVAAEPPQPSRFRKTASWMSGLSTPWQGSRRVARS